MLSTTTELVDELHNEAGSEMRLWGISRTGTAPSNKVVAALALECSERAGDMAVGVVDSGVSSSVLNMEAARSMLVMLVGINGSSVENPFRELGFTAARICSVKIWAQSS